MNTFEELDDFKEELRCAICHEYFVHAYTLTCSHSFCLTCINGWQQSHNDCPMCRRVIAGMAPSRALDNMVAALNNSAAASSSVNVEDAISLPPLEFRDPPVPQGEVYHNTVFLGHNEADLGVDHDDVDSDSDSDIFHFDDYSEGSMADEFHEELHTPTYSSNDENDGSFFDDLEEEDFLDEFIEEEESGDSDDNFDTDEEDEGSGYSEEEYDNRYGSLDSSFYESDNENYEYYY